MFAITINFSDLNLSQEMERHLEKEFAYLEKITNQPREHHFKEALINYVKNIEGAEGIKETERIIKEKKYPNNYHIIRALTSYIEDMDAMRTLDKLKKEGKLDNERYYGDKETNQKLKELRI